MQTNVDPLLAGNCARHGEFVIMHLTSLFSFLYNDLFLGLYLFDYQIDGIFQSLLLLCLFGIVDSA